MRTERISALVVSEDGAAIDGIVSDRGLMNALADQGIGVLEQRVGDVDDPPRCSPARAATAWARSWRR